MKALVQRQFLLFASLAVLLLGIACSGHTSQTVETSPPPAATAASAQTPEPPASGALSTATSEDLLPFDDSVLRGTLDNGLRYFIRRNSRPEGRAELWLAVNAGAMQEDSDQLGLAHFVEHMAFNGTENFAKQELIDYLEGIGMKFGPDINAFTSFDETVYMLKVPTDDSEAIETAFQILDDWASGLSLEETEIDKERGVVIEEWRLGRGAQARIRDEQFPVLFRDSRYAERLPIGEVEILESAPYDAFRRFYEDWYRPDLMAVIAVGDFNPEEIQAQIETQFGDLVNPATPRVKRLYPVPDHEETLYAISTDPEMTMTTVGVYYKLEKRSGDREQDYRRMIVEQLYHNMFNARLDEITQSADAPFLFAVSTTAGFVRAKDIYLQAAGVQQGQVESGLEALLTEVERVDRYGFTATELERAKADIMRGYEQAYNERDKIESAGLASEYMRHFLEGESVPGIEYEVALVREFLPTIDLDELNQLARDWISESNRVVLVGGPEKSGVEIASQAALAEVLQSVEGRQLDPYMDEVLDQPLLAQTPTPGKVVDRSEIEELGVTEWRLSNGARVILKPTDFKNDQVLLTGFSPGGHSLVSDEQFISAQFADTVVGEGGLGDFNRIELDKALAGQLANASAYIGELEEGVSAGASPQDLETMFQLVYMTFTQPRRDEEAFAAFTVRANAFLENRLSRPEAVFSDEMVEVLTQGHVRRRPPSLATIAEIDLDQAMRFYEDRFADAGDFTFVIVGAIELSTLEPLVATYLGGLPAIGRQETWRDVGIESPEGTQKVNVQKGIEPKSQVQLVFGGEAEFDRNGVHDIRSLGELLRIRLRESLREDMGGTYGVRSGGSLKSRPQQTFSFTVGFGCAPENSAKLTEAVFADIAKVKAGEIEAEDIQKVQETQRRQRETDLKENSFWIGVLKNYYSQGWDPRLILDFEPLVERVTSQNIQDSARRFLDENNYVLGVLLPQDPAESTP